MSDPTQPQPADSGQWAEAAGTSDATSASSSPESPATSSSAPAPADILAASGQVAQIQRAQAAATAEAPPPTPQHQPFWGKEGDLVVHRWTDPHGDKEAYGVVLGIHHDDGAEDRVEVLWISSNRSGPLPASTLENPNDTSS